MKYKIKDSIDGSGENVTVWHTDCVAQEHAVVAMYFRGMTYLLERGWSQMPFIVNPKHKAIWVENSDGVPMGGVVYEYHVANKQGWIHLIFTDKEYRGRHIYTIVQKALEVETIKLGGTSIGSMSHVDNVARLKAGAREGMLPQFHRLYKDLTPELESVKQEMSDKLRKPWSAITKERWNDRLGLD
jgi:hypothetical protein